MALYIAVYDVHPGDRKHFERLLMRISDRRTDPSGMLYIESYGSIEALLKTAQKFDVIIIDAADTYDGGSADISIATSIRDCGLNTPLALYIPENTEVNSQNLLLSKSLDNITFYTKAIKSSDLEKIVKIAKDFSDSRVSHIELRDAKDTYFVLPDDILYASREDSFMNVHLIDGKSVRIIKTLNEFIKELSGYMRYIQVGKDNIVNLNHVTKKQSHSFLLDSGDVIKYSIFEAKRMTALFEKYQTINSKK